MPQISWSALCVGGGETEAPREEVGDKQCHFKPFLSSVEQVSQASLMSLAGPLRSCSSRARPLSICHVLSMHEALGTRGGKVPASELCAERVFCGPGPDCCGTSSEDNRGVSSRCPGGRKSDVAGAADLRSPRRPGEGVRSRARDCSVFTLPFPSVFLS